MRYRSAGEYYKELFGTKVYRIALSAGCTCPNRDGKLGYGGCIFCSGSGSGEFAASRDLPVREQLRVAKEKVAAKNKDGKYIAYFQNFTNTYGDEEVLLSKYEEAIADPEVVGLAIGTRPDCISERMYEILSDLAGRTYLWVELGLQTIHEASAKWMRRGYALPVFEDAVRRLSQISGNLGVIVHVIADLPVETKAQMLETVSYCAHLPIHGIKIANLNVLRNTDLAAEYEKKPFPLMDRNEYSAFAAEAVERLRPDMVVYRLTGDGAKRDLIAPLWVADKRMTRNTIDAYFREHDVVQGRLY